MSKNTSNFPLIWTYLNSVNHTFHLTSEYLQIDERNCITVPHCSDIIWGTVFFAKNIWGNSVPPWLHHCTTPSTDVDALKLPKVSSVDSKKKTLTLGYASFSWSFFNVRWPWLSHLLIEKLSFLSITLTSNTGKDLEKRSLRVK